MKIPSYVDESLSITSPDIRSSINSYSFFHNEIKKKTLNSKNINLIMKNKTFFKLNFLANKKLYDNYNITKEKYDKLIINNILSNRNCHLVSQFKDIALINSTTKEFLSKYYTLESSIKKLLKLSNYFKNYLKYFCNPTFRINFINKIIKHNKSKKAEIYCRQNYNFVKSENEVSSSISSSSDSEDCSHSCEKRGECKTLFKNSLKKEIDEISEMISMPDSKIGGSINLNLKNEKIEIFSENKKNYSNDTTLQEIVGCIQKKKIVENINKKLGKILPKRKKITLIGKIFKDINNNIITNKKNNNQNIKTEGDINNTNNKYSSDRNFSLDNKNIYLDKKKILSNFYTKLINNNKTYKKHDVINNINKFKKPDSIRTDKKELSPRSNEKSNSIISNPKMFHILHEKNNSSPNCKKKINNKINLLISNKNKLQTNTKLNRISLKKTVTNSLSNNLTNNISKNFTNRNHPKEINLNLNEIVSYNKRNILKSNNLIGNVTSKKSRNHGIINSFYNYTNLSNENKSNNFTTFNNNTINSKLSINKLSTKTKKSKGVIYKYKSPNNDKIIQKLYTAISRNKDERKISSKNINNKPTYTLQIKDLTIDYNNINDSSKTNTIYNSGRCNTIQSKSNNPNRILSHKNNGFFKKLMKFQVKGINKVINKPKLYLKNLNINNYYSNLNSTNNMLNNYYSLSIMPFMTTSPNVLHNNNNSNQKEINITDCSMSPNKTNKLKIITTKRTKKIDNKVKSPCDKNKCKKEIKKKDASKNNILKRKSGNKVELKKHVNAVNNRKIIVNKSRNSNTNFLLSKKSGNAAYTYTEGNDFHHEKCKSLFVPFY